MKRVLFDENMPRKLRLDLPDFFIRTVQEEGWAGFENGQLRRRAASAFDVLLTTDQRMRYQQNVAQFGVGVVVIETVDTTLPNLRRLLAVIKAAIQSSQPRTVSVVPPT